MRTRILAALCTLAIAPFAAHAQGAKKPAAPPAPAAAQEDDQGEEQGDESGGETEATEVVDQPGRPGTVSTTGGKDVAPGEVHTVVKGDTLWDLSQRYLSNPWYWPKVWSYNPEIANPHWIYPGNTVRFFPAGEEVPSRVEDGTAPAGEISDVSPSDQITGDVDEASKVQVAGKIGYTPKAAPRVLREGFVTPKELDESGKIDSAFADSMMLSVPDSVYISFKKRGDAHVGDRYVVFHTETEVRHPVTGAKLGYLTRILGTVRVVALGEKLVTAQIDNSYDVISRADLVGPFGEKMFETIGPRANDKEIKNAFVITSLESGRTLLGENHVVVVDKGRTDGVQEGNTFIFTRQGDGGGDFVDPSRGQDKKYPVEDVGACMVVDVKERASTCLMTRSLREIVAGDHAEMRVGRAAQAPVTRR